MIVHFAISNNCAGLFLWYFKQVCSYNQQSSSILTSVQTDPMIAHLKKVFFCSFIPVYLNLIVVQSSVVNSIFRIGRKHGHSDISKKISLDLVIVHFAISNKCAGLFL